nr:hypothetical protein [Tanacetum cinerariifolium]
MMQICLELLTEVFVDVREKIAKKEVSTADPVTTAGEVVTIASVEDSVAPTTTTTTDVDDELTLVNTLISIKAAKPKVISTAITTPRAKGIVFYEQVQAHIPIISSSKDKGKAKNDRTREAFKKKDQIALDEEVARKLEAEITAEIEEEEMIAREKDEANRALSIEERSKLLAELIESRRKYLAAKRAEEIKNKPPTKAQRKSLMCTYMRNIEGYKPRICRIFVVENSTYLLTVPPYLDGIVKRIGSNMRRNFLSVRQRVVLDPANKWGNTASVVCEEATKGLVLVDRYERLSITRGKRTIRREIPSYLASTKAGLIIGSGLFEVDARFVSSVFLRVLAIKVEVVIGGTLLALGSGKGVRVEKPEGGVSSLPFVMPEK